MGYVMQKDAKEVHDDKRMVWKGMAGGLPRQPLTGFGQFLHFSLQLLDRSGIFHLIAYSKLTSLIHKRWWSTIAMFVYQRVVLVHPFFWRALRKCALVCATIATAEPVEMHQQLVSMNHSTGMYT